MPGPTPTTIGSAEILINANLDRLSNELAKAERLTQQFRDNAQTGMDKAVASVSSAEKAYNSLVESLNKTERVYTVLQGAQLPLLQKLSQTKETAAAAAKALEDYSFAITGMTRQAAEFDKSFGGVLAKIPLLSQYSKMASPFSFLGVPGGQAITERTISSLFSEETWKKFQSFGTVWEDTSKKIKNAQMVIADASAHMMPVDVFLGMSKSADKLNINMDSLTTAFQQLRKLSEPALGGDVFGNYLTKLSATGVINDPEGLKAFRLSNTDVERWQTVGKMITDAYNRGETLASFDMAKKLLPPDLYERFKAMPDMFERLEKSQKKLAPTVEELKVTNYAASLQDRLNDATKQITNISAEWAKEMERPWMYRPWAPWFRELFEKLPYYVDMAKAEIDKIKFGITGEVPGSTGKPRYESGFRYPFEASQNEAAAFQGGPASAFGSYDPGAAAEAAAETTRRSVRSPRRAGFGMVTPQRIVDDTNIFGQVRGTKLEPEAAIQDPSRLAELRWGDDMQNAYAKLGLAMRGTNEEMKKVIQQQLVMHETAAMGDLSKQLDELGMAYKAVERQILLMGGALATAETPLDQSQGAIAKMRVEFELFDAAVKRHGGKEMIPQWELDRIQQAGDKMRSAIMTKQAPADFSNIAGALGEAANETELYTAKMLHLEQVASTTHGRMTQEQQLRAKESADLAISNQFLTRRTSLLGEAAPVANKMLAVENQLHQARLANLGLSAKEEETIKRNTYERETGIRALQEQVDASKVQVQTMGLGVAASTAMQAVLAKEAEMGRKGVEWVGKQREEFEKWAAASGKAAAELEATRIITDAIYQHQLLPLGDQDIKIAQQLRKYFGDDIPAAMRSWLAEFLRIVDNASKLKDIIRGIQQQIDQTRIQTQTLGKGVGEATTERIVKEQQAQYLREQKKPMPPERLAEVERAAKLAGTAADEFARLKIQLDAKYEFKLLGLSDQNIEVAKRLRELYGDDIPRALGSGEAKLLRQLDFATKLKNDIRSLQEQIDRTNIERATAGMAPGEAAAQRLMMERRALAARQKETLPPEYLAAYDKYATIVGKVTQALVMEKAALDAKFGLQTMFLTDTEMRVAQLNRQLHGNEWQKYGQDALSNLTRITAALETTRDLMLGAGASIYSELVSNLRQGMSLADSWKQAWQSAIRSVVDQLIQMAIKWAILNSLQSAFGDALSGLGKGLGGGGLGTSAVELAAAAAALKVATDSLTPSAAALAAASTALAPPTAALAPIATALDAAAVGLGAAATAWAPVATELGASAVGLGASAAAIVPAAAALQTAATELGAAAVAMTAAKVIALQQGGLIGPSGLPTLSAQQGIIVPTPPSGMGTGVPIMAHPGEEVVRRDDPRNALNGGRGGGGSPPPMINISFTANGRMTSDDIREHALTIAKQVAHVFNRNPRLRPTY